LRFRDYESSKFPCAPVKANDIRTILNDLVTAKSEDLIANEVQRDQSYDQSSKDMLPPSVEEKPSVPVDKRFASHACSLLPSPPLFFIDLSPSSKEGQNVIGKDKSHVRFLLTSPPNCPAHAFRQPPQSAISYDSTRSQPIKREFMVPTRSSYHSRRTGAVPARPCPPPARPEPSPPRL
jgi:hypothetical protein